MTRTSKHTKRTHPTAKDVEETRKRFEQPGHRERIAAAYERLINKDHGAPEETPLMEERDSDLLAEFLSRFRRP